jgi:Galactose oxidase, central domain
MPTRVLETVPVGDATREVAAAATTARSQAIMAPRGHNSAATLTLTMGGVAFALEPFMNPEGAVTFRAMGPTGATLKLNNFTGELRVTVKSSTSPQVLLQRQDSSVTPSPTDNNNTVRATPPYQQRLVHLGQGLDVSPPIAATSSLAPTPIMANGNSQKRNTNNNHVTRNHTTTHQVEQVVAANRSSPLPYHSPVKRTRSNTSPTIISTIDTSGGKRSKTNQEHSLLLSQHFPPSPIAPSCQARNDNNNTKSSIRSPFASGHSQQSNLPMQQSPIMRLSQQEADCSPALQHMQQQLTDCSQRSDSDYDEQEEPMKPSPNSKEPKLLNEDSENDDDEDMEEEKHETVQQILDRQSEDDEDENSVATLKPDDYDDGEEETDKVQEQVDAMNEADSEKEENNDPRVQEKTRDECIGEVIAKEGHEQATRDDKTPAPESADDKEKEDGAFQSTTVAEDTFENDSASIATTSTVSRHESPCARWGHTMTMVDHNRLLAYGGQTFRASEKEGVVPTTLSDVHVFEVSKKSWFTPLQSSDTERHWPRQWHSATFVPERQLLICFGGEEMNPKTGRVTTSDKNNLMVLDTEILLVGKFRFFSLFCSVILCSQFPSLIFRSGTHHRFPETCLLVAVGIVQLCYQLRTITNWSFLGGSRAGNI